MSEDHESRADKVYDIVNKWRIFPRFFVLIFTWIFVDLYYWVQAMIEAGKLEGGYIAEVYIGAIIAGFVGIVTGYARTGQTPKD